MKRFSFKRLLILLALIFSITLSSCSFFPDSYEKKVIEGDQKVFDRYNDKFGITVPALSSCIGGYENSGLMDGYRMYIFEVEGDEEVLDLLHTEKNEGFKKQFTEAFITIWVDLFNANKDELVDFDKDYSWYCIIYSTSQTEYYHYEELTEDFDVLATEAYGQLVLCYQPDTNKLYVFDLWW